MTRIFYYAPQATAVWHFLWETGVIRPSEVSVLAVSDWTEISNYHNRMAADPAYFFRVIGHPAELPRDLEMWCGQNGMTVISIDDGALRRKHRRDNPEAYPPGARVRLTLDVTVADRATPLSFVEHEGLLHLINDGRNDFLISELQRGALLVTGAQAIVNVGPRPSEDSYR